MKNFSTIRVNHIMKKNTILIYALSLFSLLLLSDFCYGQDNLVPVHFSHPNIIRYDHHGFFIDSKRVYIFSAGFHYFRTTQGLWNDRLNKIKAAGFNTIETYIPWNYSEQKQGQADFKELDQFLDACAAHHLWVIIRPGPYICAEWNSGGFPNWLADKEIGYRTDTPLDIKWSKYYYDEVLPVIKKHLITHGGNVILMQLENEYNYSQIPDSIRTKYILSLYHDALNNHIDVPLITCWTSVSRDNTDPELSQIMDADNFYPGFHLNGVGRSIQSMTRTEPYSPPMVTELQGGWFAGIGGKAVRYPKKFGTDQVNDLTKYVIAHGLDAFNYYMGYGGTNFGYWGALGITNSYDYTAPITEVGGLWKKYRAVKLIGDFLHMTGPQYEVMKKVWGDASTKTSGIKLLLRGNSQQQILFVRNATDSAKIANIALKDGQKISVRMPKHGAKFLFINKNLNGVNVKNANFQFSEASKIGKTPFLLGYGQVNEHVSCTINGTPLHKTITNKDQWISAKGSLIGLTSWNRAARTRLFTNGDNTIALISDSYLINKKSIDGNLFDFNVQTRPGVDHFTLLSNKEVRQISFGRHKVHFTSQKKDRVYLNTFSCSTEHSSFKPIEITRVRVEENPELKDAKWQQIKKMSDGSYGSLGMNGFYKNGYYVYKGTISLPSSGYLKLSFYSNDWHGVYIDGRFMPNLSGNTFSNSANLDNVNLNRGKEHTIRIVYEYGSRLNFPDVIRNQLKGLVAISYWQKSHLKKLSNWKLSPHPAGQLTANPAKAQTWFYDLNWPNFKVKDWRELYRLGLANQTSSWYRSYFNLSKQDAGDSQLHLDFQAIYGNATVFINGHKVKEQSGRYTSFDVPLAGLVHTGQNVVAVYIRNQKGLGGIYRPAVLEYADEKIPVHLKVKEGLSGLNQGWNQEESVRSFHGKKVNIDQSLSHDGHIVWYRATFDLQSHKDWVIPIAAKIKATGYAQIWINGHLQGRYFPQGPQKMFYLPKSWLKKGKNTLVLVLRPSEKFGNKPKISALSIVPYSKYVVKNHDLRIVLK